MGTNLLTLQSGNFTAQVRNAKPLTTDDVTALSDTSAAPDIAAVAAVVSTRTTVTANGISDTIEVSGVTSRNAQISNDTVSEGSYITDQQVKSWSTVAVIGQTTATNLFGTTSGVVGQKIRINGQNYEVIGVLASKGGTSLGNQDDRVLVPLSTAQRRLVRRYPANRVDLVAYHPYGPLYYTTKATSGGVLNADDLSSSLNWIRQQQTDRRQKVVDRLTANGRPASTPLMATEWNPSSWEGTYYFGLNRTVAHALGIAETIFTFADLGFAAAQYWDYVNYPSSGVTEAPGQKVYKALQSNIGDRLLDTLMEQDFRLYTTLDSATGALTIWAINFSEHNDKTIRFQLPGASGVSITRHTLAAASGSTSLVMKNNTSDPADNVTWAVSDLTAGIDPSGFTLTFPRATLTMLRFERPLKSLPDGARVTMAGKCVTAVCPSEGYLYIEQDDRSCGIRVAGDCAGISVGDRITVTGTFGTRRPDGVTASERYISAGSIVRTSSAGAIKPLAMTCRAIGGAPSYGTAGVVGPCGPSNIGLLTTIAGTIERVVDGETFYLDDGSGTPDTNVDTGVLVRCPTTAGIHTGDIAAVTGVIEGNVPQGWSVNRRCVRARSAADVHVMP
jgi:hypothetical protein